MSEEEMFPRPFKDWTDDELWKAMRKRRTSKKQENIRFELLLRLSKARADVEHWKENAEMCEKWREQERKENKRFTDKLLGIEEKDDETSESHNP